MKTLIIIVSIILLSYQIDRFFTKDRAVAPIENKYTATAFEQELSSNEIQIPEVIADTDETAIPQAEAVLEEELVIAPETPGNDNIVLAVADENAVALAANASITTKEEKVATRNVRLKQVSKINQHAKMFHSRLKDLGNYVSLNTVQFDYNKFDVLESEDFNTVMHYADMLIFDESLKVSVAGFSDSIGSASYNEQLSLMRAVHVQNYLIDLGVKEEQILVSAYGVESPVADNATKEGRALNRRVELILLAN